MYEYEFELEGVPTPQAPTTRLSAGAQAQLFRQLAGLAQSGTSSPALRRIGMSAARTAMQSGLGPQIAGRPSQQSELEFEGEFEGEYEGEFESEFEGEFEGEMNPIRRVYPQALMEHLGHAAAEAESEAEAEAFAAALVPLATRLIPRAAPALLRAAPRLIQSVSRVTRMLRRNPTTRPLVRVLPGIMRRTAIDVARRIGRGQRLSPQMAVRSLAAQTARVLSNPSATVRAYRRSCALDRRYHRTVARPRPRTLAR